MGLLWEVCVGNHQMQTTMATQHSTEMDWGICQGGIQLSSLRKGRANKLCCSPIGHWSIRVQGEGENHLLSNVYMTFCGTITKSLEEFTGKFNFRNWQFIKYEWTSVLRETQTLVLEALDIWKKNVHKLWYFCPSQKWGQQTWVDNEQGCTENCKHNHSLHPSPADGLENVKGSPPLPSRHSHMCTKRSTPPWGSTQVLSTNFLHFLHEDCLWNLCSWFMCCRRQLVLRINLLLSA